MTLPLNKAPANPSLADALNQLKKDIFLSFNAHHIATIQTFNASAQTATATVNYQKTFFDLDATTGLYSPVLVDYPILIDCPVVCLGGGSGALTFPVATGDQCLVLFNDRDIDNWFTGATSGPVATPRLHSFSDGVLLVGLHSKANPLAGYDATRACLRGNAAGTTFVGVGATKIKIANPTTTLNTRLDQLITHLKTMAGHIQTLVAQTAAITVTPGSLVGPSSPPLNAAAITAVTALLTADVANLTADAAAIAGLLE